MNKINFLGILRNYPDNSFPDGALNEAINIRYWNNAWRTTGNKAVKFSNVRTFDTYHVHTIDESRIFIGYDKASGYLRYAVNAFPSLTSDGINIGTYNDIKITSIGNTLSIDVYDTTITIYAVFDLGKGKYNDPFTMSFDTIKIGFNPSTGFIYPLPTGIAKYYRHTWSGKDVYLGYNGTNVIYWQYSITKAGATIVNQTVLAAAANTPTPVFYYDKVNLNHLTVYQTSNAVNGYFVYQFDPATNKFTFLFNSLSDTLVKIDEFKNDRKITFHAEGDSDAHNLAFAAAMNKAAEEARKRGEYEGFIMVCYALRLFDGTYIKHSAPELLYVGSRNAYLNNSAGDYSLEPFEFGSIIYDIKDGERGVIDKLKAMKDIVTSVDIFITKPITLIDVENTFYTNKSLGGYQCDIKSRTPYAALNYKTVIEQPNFYLIHSIPVEKLAPVEGISTRCNVFADNTTTNNISNIASFTYLTIDNYSHHCITGRTKWVYNKRVIKGDIITKLYGGFSLGYFLGQRSLAGTSAMILETELTTEDGTKIVRSAQFDSSLTSLTMPDLITYPDSRAKVMRILIKNGTGWSVWKTMNLTKHPFLNLSYCINPNAMANLLSYSNDVSIQDNEILANLTIPNPATLPLSSTQVNDTVYNTNGVWASEVNNPFLFPAKNLYQAGSGKVLALVANTLPISAGQYGQHPIFVGCSDGWFALNIAGGEVFIGSITPLNGTVCTNSKSVTHVDSSVIFASAEGLMLLQGTQCINISTQLCTQPAQPLSSDTYFQKFVNDPLLVQLNAFSTVDFREYLKEAEICFDSHYREVIVSNKNYSYSYIYAIDTKLWTKISRVFSNYLFDYPSVYSVDSSTGTLIQMNKEDYSNSQEFIMCTQPIDLNEEGYKKFERLILRCSINQRENKKFGFYLYGSQDGREWQLYDGMQPAGKFNSLTLLRSLTFKYVIVVVAGDVDKDSYVTYLEYSAVSKLANKLR